MSSARREWLVESLLPYAPAVPLASLPNAPDFLRRLLGETVLSAPLPLSPSVAALWHALLLAPDNAAPVVAYLISCGSEARHLSEAAQALLVSLYCASPELVAPALAERLTCEHTLAHLLGSHTGAAVQDAFVQRDFACALLTEVASAAPAALAPFLPVVAAFALPRIDSAECVAARALLARTCDIIAATAADAPATRAAAEALRTYAAQLTHPSAPLEPWWRTDAALLEAPSVAADVPPPTGHHREGVAATELLRALAAAMSAAQLAALGSQLLGWSLRYQDLCLSLRTQELFLAVSRPLDVPAIDSHLCALLQTLAELEQLPPPVAAQHRASDLVFSQRRAKAVMLLRALEAAVEETASAEVLQKLFWAASALLDVPSLPYLPLADAALALLNAVLRHPLWPAAEHQACAALAQRGADFDGILWPLLRVRHRPHCTHTTSASPTSAPAHRDAAYLRTHSW